MKMAINTMISWNISQDILSHGYRHIKAKQNFEMVFISYFTYCPESVKEIVLIETNIKTLFVPSETHGIRISIVSPNIVCIGALKSDV